MAVSMFCIAHKIVVLENLGLKTSISCEYTYLVFFANSIFWYEYKQAFLNLMYD